MTEGPGYLRAEGEYIPGSGVVVYFSPPLQRYYIVVDAEDVKHSDLIRSWVEALANASKQANEDKEAIRSWRESSPAKPKS